MPGDIVLCWSTALCGRVFLCTDSKLWYCVYITTRMSLRFQVAGKIQQVHCRQEIKWLGISRCWRHMWVAFVLGSLPCSERFFSGYFGFPLSSKTNISKFQFDQESGRRRTTVWMCYPQIIISFFLSLFWFHFFFYFPMKVAKGHVHNNQEKSPAPCS